MSNPDLSDEFSDRQMLRMVMRNQMQIAEVLMNMCGGLQGMGIGYAANRAKELRDMIERDLKVILR